MYCGWKADWWKNEGRRAQDLDSPALEEGLHAYAAQQAHQEQSMAANFARKWGVVRRNARSIIDGVQGSAETNSVSPITRESMESIRIDVDVDQDDPDHEAMLSDFEE